SRFDCSNVLRTAGWGKPASTVPLVKAAQTSLTLVLWSIKRETITPMSLIGSLLTNPASRSTSSPWDFCRCSMALPNTSRNALFSFSKPLCSASTRSNRCFSSIQPCCTSSTDVTGRLKITVCVSSVMHLIFLQGKGPFHPFFECEHCAARDPQPVAALCQRRRRSRPELQQTKRPSAQETVALPPSEPISSRR